jgi:hydrogenase maturation protein HypF
MIRKCYFVEGRVQGVGFRPYIYKIAMQLHLSGWVKNTQEGVIIEVEGVEETVETFQEMLQKREQLPRLASIIKITINEVPPLYKEQFEIVQSTVTRAKKSAMVVPDVAVCDDCLEETFAHNLKRYHHYFATTCTNCGPRYSILQTVPYDRVNTSMKIFEMCPACQEEYDDPLNRRYHAQPISCHHCGPELNGSIEECANKIRDGRIVAIKGIGGFHLVCDASNDEIVEKLRAFKNRPTKPFAVMCKDLSQLKRCAILNSFEVSVLTSKESPIVILQKKDTPLLSQYIAPHIHRVGCFLPYTPLQHLLFQYLDTPIVATSANLGNEPIITDSQDIATKLPFVEYILSYNREILNAIDDSLVQVINKRVQILRHARGYAPQVIKLPYKIDKKILAVGANQKNTIALAYEDNLILSPHIGDLNSVKSFDFFQRTLQTFKNFYDFEPDIIVHDKHPNYETTKWAQAQNKECFEVQHHLAHIYAAKIEHNLNGDYVGFSFDGTGYGDDGTLWGGEVFVGDERTYHFKPLKLLGGEKAVKEPRRVALSLLFEHYTLDEVLDFSLPFGRSEIELLYQSYTKNLNAPLSSSVGRLFDGIASLANLCHAQSYEGEAGLLCEKAYQKEITCNFEFEIIDGVIDIAFDFFSANLVSCFMNTLVEIVLHIAKKEAKEVILSGGVFQNKILLELLIARFEREKIDYYYQQRTPINDGGISLGQINYFLEKNSKI